MIFEMKLREKPFKLIKSGKKIYELRLFDEKRKKIKIGDKIEFTNMEFPQEKILVEVVDICIFSSFIDLYANLPLLEIGYTEEDITTASPLDMAKYYSIEEQEKFSVVGFKIKIL